ncbi:dTDP-4-dehydrorhamnose reductase [Treponema parvum]|uniref:dTDP-4-dehydrorhamnose reductase n=1 Tax=Treponema parvum TaxID=138851 RepID=A0A975F508_9SPIR|nr:dTDP-4-dehydrorhamnose reductase [Treponema parvum]QTQ14515.1 dTDP-4-dehydrorhamnose reductase [Treponema parvum]
MIWVIGCKGMLGSEICRQLNEKKLQYVMSDIDVDITDINALKQFAKDSDITWIVNCAGYTAVDKAESDAELARKLNETAPANIAKVADLCGAKVIHISTDYVFDGAGNSPITEDAPVSPLGVYGMTKAAGEKSIFDNTDKYYILRTAWLYGWAGKNFVYTMIKAMNTHESVKVVNDQKGTPTFAADLAGIILEIINRKEVPYGTYHVTDLGEITWWDFANEIKKQGIKTGRINETGKNCVVNPCSTYEYPTPAKRPAYSVLSKDKIQKTLEITLPDWKESLSNFLKSDLFDKERIK